MAKLFFYPNRKFVNTCCLFWYSCAIRSDDFAELRGLSSLPLLLPCGHNNEDGLNSSASIVSIYRSLGPILYNISVELLEPVVCAGQAFRVVATVEFSGNYNMPLGMQ